MLVPRSVTVAVPPRSALLGLRAGGASKAEIFWPAVWVRKPRGNGLGFRVLGSVSGVGYIGIIYWGYIGIMEKKMETTQ